MGHGQTIRGVSTCVILFNALPIWYVASVEEFHSIYIFCLRASHSKKIQEQRKYIFIRAKQE